MLVAETSITLANAIISKEFLQIGKKWSKNPMEKCKGKLVHRRTNTNYKNIKHMERCLYINTNGNSN